MKTEMKTRNMCLLFLYDDGNVKRTRILCVDYFRKWPIFTRPSAEWYIFEFWCWYLHRRRCCKRFHVIVVGRVRIVCLWRESDITLLVRISVEFSSVYFRCVVWYTRFNYVNTNVSICMRVQNLVKTNEKKDRKILKIAFSKSSREFLFIWTT